MEIEAETAGKGLIDAIGSDQWGLAVGFGIMLSVWFLRFVWTKLKKKDIPSPALPYIAVVIGALTATGMALIDNPASWFMAICSGIGAGLMGSGTWGLFGFVRKKQD